MLQEGGQLIWNFSVVRNPCEEMDAFDQIDIIADTSEMESLMVHLQPTGTPGSVTEFVIDDDLPICAELENDQ